MTIAGLDHAAIPIADPERMLAFYARLGFRIDDSKAPFYSLHFGANRINLHGPKAWRSQRFTLRGPTAQPGCGDFCFVWDGTSAELLTLLAQAGATIIEGPVPRAGGRGIDGESVYVRDPEQNLLEFMRYPD